LLGQSSCLPRDHGIVPFQFDRFAKWPDCGGILPGPSSYLVMFPSCPFRSLSACLLGFSFFQRLIRFTVKFDSSLTQPFFSPLLSFPYTFIRLLTFDPLSRARGVSTSVQMAWREERSRTKSRSAHLKICMILPP